MSNEARVRAYQAALTDPFAFLEQHFKLTPQGSSEEIASQFKDFGVLTGVQDDTIKCAIEDFCLRKSVAPFVLQAASADMVSKYETV